MRKLSREKHCDSCSAYNKDFLTNFLYKFLLIYTLRCASIGALLVSNRGIGFSESRIELLIRYIEKEKIMREGIHPDYYQAKVVCNCGNEFVTGSTKEDIHVEICSKCHSFYTGQQKAIKARGRIDKFNKKYGVQADN